MSETSEKATGAQQAAPLQRDAPAEPAQTPLSRLLASVEGCKKVLIVTHDHPDPDAISSAAALRYLLKKLSGIRCKIAFGGSVVRPENRAMLKQLKIKIVPIQQIKLSAYRCFALVDTQPKAGNNSLPHRITPSIVIDHHPPKPATKEAKFADLRPNYGATATLLTEYLLESGLPIPVHLATALFYGIASETQDLGREAGEPDNQAYLTLFPKVNKRILSNIRYARVSRNYFQTLETGLRNSFTYKNVIGSRLGEVSSQDVVPLIADLLVRLERMSWAIVLGRFDGRLFLSARSNNTRARCGQLLRRVLGKRGSAGGHDMMAGGSVPLNDKKPEEIDALESELIRRFMVQVGHKEIPNFEQLVAPIRLVPETEVPKPPPGQEAPAKEPAAKGE